MNHEITVIEKYPVCGIIAFYALVVKSFLCESFLDTVRQCLDLGTVRSGTDYKMIGYIGYG